VQNTSSAIALQPLNNPRRISSNHTVILKLSAYHGTSTDDTTIAQHRAFQDYAVAPDEAVLADLDFPTRHQIAVTTVFISEQLISGFCFNRMEIIV